MIRVGIAAPTPALRAGLRALLAAPALELVAEAATLPELLTDTPLDAIVVADEALLDDDLPLPAPAPALVLLAEDGRAAALLGGLRLPGWALLPPDAAAEQLSAALLAAANGLVVLAVPLAAQVLGPRPLAATYQETRSDDEPLTAREQEVLELLAAGLPNKQIARELSISEHTVKFHVSSIYAKLNAANRTEAINRGARRGLISF